MLLTFYAEHDHAQHFLVRRFFCWQMKTYDVTSKESFCIYGKCRTLLIISVTCCDRRKNRKICKFLAKHEQFSCSLCVVMQAIENLVEQNCRNIRGIQMNAQQRSELQTWTFLIKSSAFHVPTIKSGMVVFVIASGSSQAFRVKWNYFRTFQLTRLRYSKAPRDKSWKLSHKARLAFVLKVKLRRKYFNSIKFQ